MLVNKLVRVMWLFLAAAAIMLLLEDKNPLWLILFAWSITTYLDLTVGKIRAQMFASKSRIDAYDWSKFSARKFDLANPEFDPATMQMRAEAGRRFVGNSISIAERN